MNNQNNKKKKSEKNELENKLKILQENKKNNNENIIYIFNIIKYKYHILIFLARAYVNFVYYFDLFCTCMFTSYIILHLF